MECLIDDVWWEGLVRVTRDDGVEVYFTGPGDAEFIREDDPNRPKLR